MLIVFLVIICSHVENLKNSSCQNPNLDTFDRSLMVESQLSLKARRVAFDSQGQSHSPSSSSVRFH